LEFLMRQFFKLWLSLRLTKSTITSKPVDFQGFYFIGDKKTYSTLKNRFTDLKKIDNPSQIAQKPAMLIFDTGSLHFSKIISLMETYKNQSIYFRFYFAENQMLLGSDYKDALGEVSLVES